MNCPKCNYERQPADRAPDWQCPSCKVAYSKVLHAQNLNLETVDEEYFEEPEENSSGRRIHGLLLIIGGSIGFVITLAFSAYLARNGYTSARGGPPVIGLLIVAIIVVLIGSIELLTGGKFRQLSEKWDGLRNWQKGILAIIIAFSPLIIISIGMKIFIG